MSFEWRFYFSLCGGCLWCVRELYAINKYHINQKSFSFKLFNCVRESRMCLRVLYNVVYMVLLYSEILTQNLWLYMLTSKQSIVNTYCWWHSFSNEYMPLYYSLEFSVLLLVLWIISIRCVRRRNFFPFYVIHSHDFVIVNTRVCGETIIDIKISVPKGCILN